MIKDIKFEGVWGKVEAKECFQRQSFLSEIAHYGKSIISDAQQIFVSINNIFLFGRKTGHWAEIV